MVAVSLMPPVDYCASCEGKKAETKARDVASARETEAFETQRTNDNAQPSPGSLPPIATDDAKTKPIDTVARPLLSPDLAVQASLASAEGGPVDEGANPALRLQAFQAYSALPGTKPGS